MEFAFQCLHDWHHNMIKKLGWIILSKNRYDNQLKVESYLSGIDHLIACLEKKHKDTHDYDRKEDLRVYLQNTIFFKQVAEFMLDEKLHDITMKCEGKHPSDATMHGLQKWMKYKFEKLGWLAFAQRSGDELKIRTYLDSIQRLKASLKLKIGNVKEKDRANDLQIIWDNVCVLDSAVNKLKLISSGKLMQGMQPFIIQPMPGSMIHSIKRTKRTKKAKRH